jgi:uncharacterized membrane protein YqjE
VVGLAHDQFHLAALEARQAVLRLVLMAGLALLAAALVATAWLGAAGAGVYWLVERGLSPVLALLLGGGVSLLAALACVAALRREGHKLPFEATLRTLQRKTAREQGSR